MFEKTNHVLRQIESVGKKYGLSTCRHEIGEDDAGFVDISFLDSGQAPTNVSILRLSYGGHETIISGPYFECDQSDLMTVNWDIFAQACVKAEKVKQEIDAYLDEIGVRTQFDFYKGWQLP